MKKRLEVIGNPNYSLQLRKKIIDVKEQIHILEEEKRRLLNEKFIRERKINKVIMAGQPDAMQESQEKVKELTVLFDRIHKVDKKLEFQDKTKNDAEKQLAEIQDKLAGLEAEAEEKGLNLDEIYANDDANLTDLSKDSKTYERKLNVIQQAIDTSQMTN